MKILGPNLDDLMDFFININNYMSLMLLKRLYV